MQNFDQYLMDLERELLDLKTIGRNSSSSLATTSQTITITQQIVGYSVNYHFDNCAAQYTAEMELVPNDGKTMLSSICLTSSAQALNGRFAKIIPRIKNGHPTYDFFFVSGSPADLAIIQGGGTVPPTSMTFKISATSEFSVNLTYRENIFT